MLRKSILGPLIRPIEAFFHLAAVGGIVLMINTGMALVWANSPWSETYSLVWHTQVSVGLRMSHL